MKNGFTLIELIGTVVILSIIALIALPATLSMLSSGQNQVDESVQQMAKKAAKAYVNDRKNEYRKPAEASSATNNHGSVSITTLRDTGYLSTTLYDKNCHIKNDYINITSNSKRFFFEYKSVTDNEEC